MANDIVKEPTLPELFTLALQVMEVVKAIRPYGAEDFSQLSPAYADLLHTLDTLIICILQTHLSEVTVVLDPKRPQFWRDPLSRLKITYGNKVVRIPVAVLINRLRTNEQLLERIKMTTYTWAQKREIIANGLELGVVPKWATHAEIEATRQWLDAKKTEEVKTCKVCGHPKSMHQPDGICHFPGCTRTEACYMTTET